MDEELALLPGSLSPTLHAWAVRLGTWMPFPEVAKIIEAICQTAISEASTRRKTEAAGAVYVQLQEETVLALETGRIEAEQGPPRLVASFDGAMVPDDRQRRWHKQQQPRAARAAPHPAPTPSITLASVKVLTAAPPPELPPEKRPCCPASNHPWRRSPIGRARFRSY